MKTTLVLLGAIALFGLNACSDTVTRRTTTYQQTSSSLPSIAPGTVLDDGTTTSRTTRRVDTIERD